MKPNRTSMKKLAVIVAVVTIIGFAYYTTSPRFATGTSETEALGYWVKPNGLREWEGHFAGEHALFRLDEDGSAHVFARGLYSDQFVDVFKTGIKVSNGTNIQPFDHGKWRITNDERGLTLDLNFGHNWHRFEIQAADASTLALRPTYYSLREFQLHRMPATDLAQLQQNPYYAPRFEAAEEYQPGEKSAKARQ